MGVFHLVACHVLMLLPSAKKTHQNAFAAGAMCELCWESLHCSTRPGPHPSQCFGFSTNYNNSMAVVIDALFPLSEVAGSSPTGTTFE